MLGVPRSEIPLLLSGGRIDGKYKLAVNISLARSVDGAADHGDAGVADPASSDFQASFGPPAGNDFISPVSGNVVPVDARHWANRRRGQAGGTNRRRRR